MADPFHLFESLLILIKILKMSLTTLINREIPKFLFLNNNFIFFLFITFTIPRFLTSLLLLLLSSFVLLLKYYFSTLIFFF